MYFFKIITLFLISINLLGCVSLLKPSNRSSDTGGSWDVIFNDATGLSYTALKVKKDALTQDHICRSSSVDAITGEVTKASFAANVSQPAAGAANVKGDSANAGVSGVTLGGRTPAVLIVREVLYRTCEFLGNYRELSPEIAEKTFSKVIDVVAEIAIGVSKVDKTIDSSASPNTNKINTQVQDQYKNINQQQSNKPIGPSGESNPSKDSGYDPYGDSK